MLSSAQATPVPILFGVYFVCTWQVMLGKADKQFTDGRDLASLERATTTTHP